MARLLFLALMLSVLLPALHSSLAGGTSAPTAAATLSTSVDQIEPRGVAPATCDACGQHPHSAQFFRLPLHPELLVLSTGVQVAPAERPSASHEIRPLTPPPRPLG